MCAIFTSFLCELACMVYGPTAYVKVRMNAGNQLGHISHVRRAEHTSVTFRHIPWLLTWQVRFE